MIQNLCMLSKFTRQLCSNKKWTRPKSKKFFRKDWVYKTNNPKTKKQIKQIKSSQIKFTHLSLE